MFSNVKSLGVAATALVLGTAAIFPAGAQVIASPFSSNYTISYNAAVADVPGSYGGVLISGDLNSLLIMGAANDPAGALYSVPLIRGVDGHITGFGPTATLYATAPFNDGGLIYAPNGTLLYTRWPVNELGEIKPGSTVTNKTVDLSALGVNSSVGTLQYVPTGFGGAGKLKLAVVDTGDWYDATLSDDGAGGYNVSASGVVANSADNPESITYVRAGNPDFAANSVLVSEINDDRISAYQVDANGNPIVGTRQDFVTGATGAEGGTIDPLTGDFIFSTFGDSNKVIIIRGFTLQASTPEPGTNALLITSGLTGLGIYLRRRRAKK